MSLKIKLFVASLIKDVSKESGREYFCVQGKIFPKEKGYGERFFFDYVLARDVRDEAIASPFNQNSELAVEFGYDKQILKFSVVKQGNGPAAIKDMKEIYASAKARSDSKAVPAGNGKVVACNESIAR